MPRIVAFGGLALVGDDGRLLETPVRGRNLALLALLARAGRAGMTREKLSAYLWPESDAERARHSLDQALYTVRRALGADPFITVAATLALDAAVLPNDVADFTAALESGSSSEAVELYGGAFLDGFHLSDAPELERWIDAERAALHDRYAAALETLAREAAEAGDETRSIGCWRRLAAASPLSSRVALELMRALDRAGDRASALAAGTTHAALVRQELDAPPDPSILEYCEALRRPPERAPAATGPGPTTTEPRQTAPPGPERRRRPGRRSLWIGTGLLVGLVVAVTVAASRRSVHEEARPRVAVVPFENATGDSTLDPLGPMAADWITEGLIRTGLVELVEPSPATAGVAVVVEGRVYRTGDSIRVQARITEPGTGVVVRALEAAAADATRPTETLEPLRQRVVGALGTLYDPRLVAWAGGALRPPSFEAYQEFAAGVERHAVPRDLPAAAERFRRAAELDPDYALPRLWLAWTMVMMEDYAAADSVVTEAASRRQAMSPLERAWHDRIAALLAGDNERSYEAARRMLEIVPRSGWALALANAALDTNRPDVTVSTLLEVGMDNLGLEQEHGWSLLTAAYHQLGEYRRELAATEAAIRTVGLDWGFVGPGVSALAALGDVEALEHRIARLNVLSPTYGAPPGVAALRAGVAELRAHGFGFEAEALADRMLNRVFPAAGATRDSVARLMRIETLYELGRWDEAEQALVMMFADSSGGFRVTALAGLLAARRGDPGRARRIEAELAGLDQPYLFGEPTFWRARIAAALGDRAAALRLLRQAFAEGAGGRAWYQLHILRDFEALRDELDYRDLVGRP